MKPSNFLFHVPGCKDLYDTREHEYLYDKNWLTLEELQQMPEQYLPETVDVIQIRGNLRQRLGRVATALAVLKFGD
jgi:hypothetical protein